MLVLLQNVTLHHQLVLIVSEFVLMASIDFNSAIIITCICLFAIGMCVCVIYRERSMMDGRLMCGAVELFSTPYLLLVTAA